MRAFRILILIFIIFILGRSNSYAQLKQDVPIIPTMSELGIDMQWFLSFQTGEDKGKSISQFGLKRGYVNIKKTINKNFSGRITTDITVDKEGDGMGDVEMRLKYLYLKYSLPSAGIFIKPYLEFGLVHRPWIDFEQEINHYRVQGSMFLERNSVIDSGDNGVTLISLLGEELDKPIQETLSSSFPGKYGSFAIGIFNGGGYHSLEKNIGKTLEGRLTIRPLHNILPGLQFTYHGAYGKGNIAESPDWHYNSGFVSLEQTNLIFTSTYYQGKGNFEGSAIRDTISFDAIPQNGYSLFGELKLFHKSISLFGRYDYFEQKYNSGKNLTKRGITGIAYHFVKNCKVLIDFDKVDYSSNSKKDSHIFEIAIELKY